MNRELEKKLSIAWEAVSTQQEQDIDLRSGAYVIAIDRVAEAERLRGFE